jgi:hypothetical protein
MTANLQVGKSASRQVGRECWWNGAVLSGDALVLRRTRRGVFHIAQSAALRTLGQLNSCGKGGRSRKTGQQCMVETRCIGDGWESFEGGWNGLTLGLWQQGTMFAATQDVHNWER